MQHYNKDYSDLNQLATFHYVLGGIGCFFCLIPLLHVFGGISLILHPERFESSEQVFPSVYIGWIAIGMGGLFFLLGEVFSICLILSGKYLRQQKNYMFSFVLACFCCLNMPLGTILGIFTIVVLQRESVKSIYDKDKSAYIDSPSSGVTIGPPTSGVTNV